MILCCIQLGSSLHDINSRDNVHLFLSILGLKSIYQLNVDTEFFKLYVYYREMYKHVFKKVTFCFHETKNIFHEFKPYHKSYLFYVRSPVTILYKDCRGQG